MYEGLVRYARSPRGQEGSSWGKRASIQYPQAKNTDNPQLLAPTNLQLPHKTSRQAQNRYIQYNIRDARTNVHNRIVRCWETICPVAPDRPDLKECSEEEGDEPAEGEGYEDPDDAGEAPGGEEAAVEAENGEFNEGYGYDVPELFYEEDLREGLDSLQEFGRSGGTGTHFEEEDSLVVI